MGTSWGAASNEFCSSLNNSSKNRRDYRSGPMLRIDIDLWLPGLRYCQVTLPNDLFAYRFISCGRPHESALAFRELFNVIHWQVWVVLVLTLIASLLFKIHTIDPPKNLTFNMVLRDTLNYLRIFLEQDSQLLSINENTS